MTDDVEAFREFMSRHLARFSDLSAEWTSRLCASDRDWLIATAFNVAYARRYALDPRRQSPVRWFESCMQEAADKRPHWWTITSTGWVSVPSRELRRRR